jgi:hypothetical protein
LPATATGCRAGNETSHCGELSAAKIKRLSGDAMKTLQAARGMIRGAEVR